MSQQLFSAGVFPLQLLWYFCKTPWYFIRICIDPPAADVPRHQVMWLPPSCTLPGCVYMLDRLLAVPSERTCIQWNYSMLNSSTWILAWATACFDFESLKDRKQCSPTAASTNGLRQVWRWYTNIAAWMCPYMEVSGNFLVYDVIAMGLYWLASWSTGV